MVEAAKLKTAVVRLDRLQISVQYKLSIKW
jgi:hypothetical protein